LDRTQRLRAGIGNALEWLADRNADLEHKAQEVEAKARRFYGEAGRGAHQVVDRTYVGLQQIWYGTPGATKGTIIGGSVMWPAFGRDEEVR
jgi:hypothetical protein